MIKRPKKNNCMATKGNHLTGMILVNQTRWKSISCFTDHAVNKTYMYSYGWIEMLINNGHFYGPNLFGFAWTIQGLLSFKQYRICWKIKDYCNSLWNLLEALKWKMKSFHSKVCKDSLLKTIRIESLFGGFSRHDCKFLFWLWKLLELHVESFGSYTCL